MFTHAHVNTAVCQPCRQSWLTGRFPHNNGAEGFEPIDSDVSTLTEQLKSLGYVNGILGKEIHHQPMERFFWDFIPFKTESDSVWRKGNSRDPNLFYRYSSKFFEMVKEKKKPDRKRNMHTLYPSVFYFEVSGGNFHRQALELTEVLQSP